MKTWLMRAPLFLLGLGLALAGIGAIAFRLANRTNGSLVSSGKRRRYLLYVPKSYNPAIPAPLVITIHGFAQYPAHQMGLTRWNELANEHGFLVVYPAGTGFPLRWHAGGRFGAGVAAEVRFFSDLIDKLQAEYNIDPSRIYANGLSNGGGMTFVLSCELSERIAAAGLVASAHQYPWDACRPARPVPTIVFHGTADPIVPFAGGRSGGPGLPFPAIPEWVEVLARSCGSTGTPEPLPSRGAVSGVAYTHGAADVVFYTIAGGGHTWPGGQELPRWLTGPTSQDIDATRVMWDFFTAHPLA